MDKQWKKLQRLFIHRLCTAHGTAVQLVLGDVFSFKLLKNIKIIKLSTGLGGLNNNSNL